MFDAASDIRIEWSVVEKCLEPLMASTMLDVPALDIVKCCINWVADSHAPHSCRKGNQKCNGVLEVEIRPLIKSLSRPSTWVQNWYADDSSCTAKLTHLRE